MWFGGWWMALWILLVVAVVVVVAIWGVRALSDEGRRSSPGGERSALRILEERYARGEIDRDEFEERRSSLEGP